MSERSHMLLIALGMLVVAVICATIFAASGFTLGWMIATAVFTVGAGMAALLSVAA